MSGCCPDVPSENLLCDADESKIGNREGHGFAVIPELLATLVRRSLIEISQGCRPGSSAWRRREDFRQSSRLRYPVVVAPREYPVERPVSGALVLSDDSRRPFNDAGPARGSERIAVRAVPRQLPEPRGPCPLPLGLERGARRCTVGPARHRRDDRDAIHTQLAKRAARADWWEDQRLWDQLLPNERRGVEDARSGLALRGNASPSADDVVAAANLGLWTGLQSRHPMHNYEANLWRPRLRAGLPNYTGSR